MYGIGKLTLISQSGIEKLVNFLLQITQRDNFYPSADAQNISITRSLSFVIFAPDKVFALSWET